MAGGDPVEGENVAVCGRHPVLLGGVTEGPDYVGLQEVSRWNRVHSHISHMLVH